MAFAEEIIDLAIREYPCCQAWAVPVSMLEKQERAFLRGFAPHLKTAVVLGHHITTKAEWTWRLGEDEKECCSADDHTSAVCGEIGSALMSHGYMSDVVPYPGASGLLFRRVAQAAGAGGMGLNAFLLHPEWGPWIHLRVLVTDAGSDKKSVSCLSVCNSCGICALKCPAGAIRPGGFDGLQCRKYRRDKGEYIPEGAQRHLNYCAICADFCPIGPKPV